MSMSVARMPLTLAAGLRSNNVWRLRQAQWPYPWIYPPHDGSFVNFEGAVDPPVGYGPSDAVVCLQYTVPDGFFFVLTGILATISGNPLADGTGQYIWNLSVNVPTQVGGLSLPGLANGYAVENMSAFTISKGSPSSGPWPINSRIFQPRDVVTLSVQTANPFPVSPPTAFISGFYGWTWPEEDDPEIAGA